jgi:hypothetical protein
VFSRAFFLSGADRSYLQDVPSSNKLDNKPPEPASGLVQPVSGMTWLRFVSGYSVVVVGGRAVRDDGL